MDEAGESRTGIFGSLRRLLRLGVAIAHNRLELLLVEMQEERWRFFNALLLVGAALILAALTLMVATITVVVVCLKHNREDLLIGLMLLYLVATVVAFWRLRSRLKNWEPFSATLAELKKDKECLEEKS
jgi:uncharacterized membrane protein YqjE